MNPQKENGYTAIANEIMEALARFRLPGEARQMLDVIIRKTYGFNKKKDQIATSQFMKATGLHNFSIHRARARLLLAKMITVSKNANSQILTYSFQKDYDKWIPYAKKHTVSKNANHCKQKSAQTYRNNAIHKRHKDTITKDSSAKPHFLRDVINEYLDLQGVEEQSLRNVQFKKCLRAGKEMLQAVNNDVDRAITVLNMAKDYFQNKGLSWSISAVVKNMHNIEQKQKHPLSGVK